MDTTDFSSDTKKLQNIAAQTSAGIVQHFGKIATAVVGIGAAFIGVRAALQAFNAAIDMGGKLNDLSARTGESAGNLAILQRAFENAGAGADAVGPTINRLQRAIIEAGEGGKQQAEAFAKLGLSLFDIRNLTPTEQLQAVAKALQGVSNDSERSAIAMQLLGRSGGELLPLLRAMGVEMEVARRQLGGLPGVMDRTNQALDTIGDNFGAIASKGAEFAAGLLEKLAPALANITTKIAEIDAAGFGSMISGYIEVAARWISQTFKLSSALDSVKLAIDGITSGEFGKGMELLFLTARITASNAINEITSMAMAGLSSIGSFLVDTLGPDSAAFRILKNGFDVLATQLGISLTENILKAIEGIPFLEGIRDNMRAAIDWAKDDVAMLTSWIKEDIAELGTEMGDAAKKFPTNFSEAYENYAKSPLIETRSLLEQQKQLSAELAANIRSAGINAGDFAAAMRNNPLYKGLGASGMANAPIGSPRPDFKAPGIFGMKPDSLPPIESGGGGASRRKAAKTPFERLRDEANNFNKDAMRDIGRIGDRAARADQRAKDLADRGMHRAASNAAARAERIRQEEADKALKRMGKDAAKTEAERKKDEQRNKGESDSPASADPTEQIYKFLTETFFKDFQARLPQNALSP